MPTSMVTVRMDSAIKRQAEVLFAELGLNMSTALNAFVRMAVRENRIPFEFRSVGAPSTQTPTPLRQRVIAARDQIVELAARRGASNVRLFGSVARGTEKATSDVDILIDTTDSFGLLDHAGLQTELAELLNAPVDVVPVRTLKPRVADQVRAEAIPL